MKSTNEMARRRRNEVLSCDFTPITIAKYVKKHANSKPGTNPVELSRLLRAALEEKLAGVLCQCGQPIWALGSAYAGNMCFTCITGEPIPDHDYEIVDEG